MKERLELQLQTTTQRLNSIETKFEQFSPSMGKMNQWESRVNEMSGQFDFLRDEDDLENNSRRNNLMVFSMN